MVQGSRCQFVLKFASVNLAVVAKMYCAVCYSAIYLAWNFARYKRDSASGGTGNSHVPLGSSLRCYRVLSGE